MFAITALHITAHTNANDFECPDAADGCAHAVWRGRGDLYVHAHAPRPRRMRAPRGSEQRLVLARLAKLQVPTCQHTPSCCSGGERGAQGYPQVVGGPLLLAPGGALTANSPRAVRSGQTRRLS